MSTSQALVKDLEGEVSVTRNGEVVNIKVGDYLLPGDQVVTGDTGRLGLEFPGVEGQEPAAGVMTPNGKIMLGEQDSPNGPQMLVMEETECFEFTTEITELSSVAQDGGASGLFGGMVNAGGLLTSALGALATGMFVGAGGGDDNNSNDSIPAPSNDGGFGFSGGGAQSALAPVVGEDSPVAEAITAAAGPSTPVGQATAPVATPIADVINEVVSTVNNSPLGVVTQPVTDVALGLVSGTVLGSGTQGGADAGDTAGIPATGGASDPGPDHIVKAVQDTVAGLQDDPASTSPEGLVQGVVEAVQQDVSELASAGGSNPINGLVDTVIDGVNQTPLGEPLSPVTEQVQALTDTFDLNSLITAGTDAGLVTTVVDTVGGALEPVTSQVEPLATVVGTLHDTAVTVDSVLADTLGSVEGLFGGAESLSTAGGLPTDSLSADALPATLEEATGGLLGTVESLAAQLQSGGAEDPTGGLLDTAVSTISSTAADPASSDLSSALNNLLNGLG